MNKSPFLQALTLSLSLFASANVFAASATQMLSEDLQAGIKTLPRETRLYHYFGIDLGGRKLENTNLRKADERYEMVQTRVKQMAANFWDLKNNTTQLANAGLGVYFAVDPFASSPAAAGDTGANFGSTMIEVTFNAGVKYLDLVDAVALRPETIQAIVDETGMQPADQAKLFQAKKKGFWRDTLQFMAESQNTAFRKIVHTVFDQNQIALTEYGWQAATSAFCNAATGSGRVHHSALVYVGGPSVQNAIKSMNMVYWNETSVQFDAQETESLQRNKKLYGLLETLRPLEKAYKAADDDKTSLKIIYLNMKAAISVIYSEETEITDLRLKTFDCVK